MWEDQQVWLHGDATPANFLFGHGMDVAAIDLERMKRGDRMFDVGRIAGELQHSFMAATGDKRAPNRSSAISSGSTAAISPIGNARFNPSPCGSILHGREPAADRPERYIAPDYGADWCPRPSCCCRPAE